MAPAPWGTHQEGSAAKIAAAAERERQAYAEFISGDTVEEMLTVNSARLAALGELLGQIDRTWANRQSRLAVHDRLRDGLGCWA